LSHTYCRSKTPTFSLEERGFVVVSWFLTQIFCPDMSQIYMGKKKKKRRLWGIIMDAPCIFPSQLPMDAPMAIPWHPSLRTWATWDYRREAAMT
jgi:hypothetical protein